MRLKLVLPLFFFSFFYVMDYLHIIYLPLSDVASICAIRFMSITDNLHL